jgi:hypothetical protein
VPDVPAISTPAVDTILAEVGRGAQTELRRASLEQAGRAGLGAFAVGALIRAIYGMAGAGKPPIEPSADKGLLKDTPYSEKQFSFPVPVRPRPNETDKLAQTAPNPFSGPSTPEGQWWHYPAITAAALAGGYGGYRVADRIAAARRQEQIKARLEKARAEFQAATSSLFEEPLVERAMPGHAKAASVAQLEGLYELYKSGNWADTKGKMLGTYLSIALPLAATVGYINYQDSKRRQRATLLRQVLDQRAKDRSMRSPPEFRAEPISVPPEGI